MIKLNSSDYTSAIVIYLIVLVIFGGVLLDPITLLIFILHMGIAFKMFLETKTFEKINPKNESAIIESYVNKEYIYKTEHQQFIKKDKKYNLIRIINVTTIILFALNLYFGIKNLIDEKIYNQGYVTMFINEYSVNDKTAAKISFAFIFVLLFLLLGIALIKNGIIKLIVATNNEVSTSIDQYEKSVDYNSAIEKSKNQLKSYSTSMMMTIFVLFFTIFYHLVLFNKCILVVLLVQIILALAYLIYFKVKSRTGDERLAIKDEILTVIDQGEDHENVNIITKTENGISKEKIIRSSNKSFNLEYNIGSTTNLFLDHTIFFFKQPVVNNIYFLTFVLYIVNFIFGFYNFFTNKYDIKFGVISFNNFDGSKSWIVFSAIFGIIGLYLAFFATVSFIGCIRAYKQSMKKSLEGNHLK